MTDVVDQEVKPLSEVERVVDTFIAPQKTFTDILRSRSWWLPFVLIAVCSYALMGAVATKVGWPQLVENQIHSQPKTEEQLASAPPERVESTKKIMMYSFMGSFAAGPIIGLVVSCIIAAVLMATMNFGFGGKATFGRAFAVAQYAWLPLGIKSLLAAVLLFVGSVSESFTMESMLGSNPGYYIDTPGALKTFLTSFDVFSIWGMALMAIGFSTIAGTKRSSGFIAVFGWWAIIVLFGTGIAAIRG